jgi:hypothetical protein
MRQRRIRCGKRLTGRLPKARGASGRAVATRRLALARGRDGKDGSEQHDTRVQARECSNQCSISNA